MAYGMNSSMGYTAAGIRDTENDCRNQRVPDQSVTRLSKFRGAFLQMSSVHSRPWRKAAETLFQHVTCPYLMFFRLSNVSSMSASTPPCLESSTLGGLDTLRLRSLDASTHGSFATPRGFAALRLRRECAFTRMPVQCSLTHSLSSYKLPQKFFGDGAIHIPYPSHL